MKQKKRPVFLCDFYFIYSNCSYENCSNSRYTICTEQISIKSCTLTNGYKPQQSAVHFHNSKIHFSFSILIHLCNFKSHSISVILFFSEYRSTSRYADLEKPKKKKTLSATTSLVSIPNTIKLSMLNSGLLSFGKFYIIEIIFVVCLFVCSFVTETYSPMKSNSDAFQFYQLYSPLRVENQRKCSTSAWLSPFFLCHKLFNRSNGIHLDFIIHSVRLDVTPLQFDCGIFSK